MLEPCPRLAECRWADVKCHLCHNLSLFAPGKGTGKGKKHEQRIAKGINTKAHLRAGSGSAAHAKGDVIDSTALFEGKSGYTQVNSKGQKTFSLKRGWLLKIEQEAIAEGRIPVLALHYDGTPEDEIWVVTRLEVLQSLRESV